jgi:hypothetical protein
MTKVSKNARIHDMDYYCAVCGGGNLSSDPLEVVQVGGGRRDWAHGHCYAMVTASFALKSVKRAIRLLQQTKFDARGAAKCIDDAMRELRGAKKDLTGKSLWANLT